MAKQGKPDTGKGREQEVSKRKVGMAPGVFTERLYAAVKKGEVVGMHLTKEQAAATSGRGVSVYRLAAQLVYVRP